MARAFFSYRISEVVTSETRRTIEGLNLSVLDIMACGLGAIILVFMLVKHNAADTVPETELLAADIARLEAEEQQIRGRIEAVKAETEQAEKGIKAASGQIASLESSVEASRQNAAQSQSKIAQLKETIEKTEIAEKSDVVESPKAGEETYLMGLKVEGRRIAILVDASASMTDETLIEIIRRKSSPDTVKRQGPKWKRTREVVRWLLARVPDISEVAVMAFNEKAIPLGGGLSRFDAKASPAPPELGRPGADRAPTASPKAMARCGSNPYVLTDGLRRRGIPTTAASSFSACRRWKAPHQLKRMPPAVPPTRRSGAKGARLNVIAAIEGTRRDPASGVDGDDRGLLRPHGKRP